MLLFLICPCPGGGMADAEDLKSSGDFSSCGFDSHPGHQCAFSNTETPERSPKKNAEAHLRSLPQKGFRSQHHRFSLQSLVCYVCSFAAIACTARLCRLRSKRLPGRCSAACSAQILFLRRLL